MEPSHRRLLLTCFYAFFCSGLVSLMLGSAMPDLKRSWGLSDSFSGVLLSAHSAGNLAAGFVSGLVPFWLGRRRSIMLLSSMAFLGMAVMAVTGAPGLLFAAFVLTGFGRGSVTNFNNHTVNVLTGGSPAAANILHACFAVGAIAAPMAFLLLSRAIAWQAGLFFVVLCGAIADGLALADPANADTYHANAEAYQAELSALDAEYQSVVDGASNKTLLFADRFPFRYMIEDYDLDYYAAFVGCSSETEASFETVMFLAGKVDELGLKNIMIIEGSDGKLADTVKNATTSQDQQILTLNSLQSVPLSAAQDGVSYLSVMRDNMEVLKQALQ